MLKERTEVLCQIVDPLLEWFCAHARILPWRETPSAYRVWISEIMLQQTRVEAVKPYFDRFIAELPDVEHLANVDEERLLKLWEGLGYYNRARNLQRAAKRIVEQYGGRLPADYDALLTLPGIGEYSAGAIASIAYGIAVPAVDGNVLRVLARLTNDDMDIALPATKRSARDVLCSVIPSTQPGAFNQALMELGATVCVPNGLPHCNECPLCKHCLGLQAGRAAQLPLKSPKKARRIEQRTVFVLMQDECIAVCKRPKQGLLAGLWELPNVLGYLDMQQMSEQLHAWHAIPSGNITVTQAHHMFTHIQWEMRVYTLPVQFTHLPQAWALTSRGSDGFALPTAFRVCLPR